MERWTQEEDDILMSAIISSFENGGTLEEACIAASDKLPNRAKIGCINHWYSALAKIDANKKLLKMAKQVFLDKGVAKPEKAIKKVVTVVNNHVDLPLVGSTSSGDVVADFLQASKALVEEVYRSRGIILKYETEMQEDKQSIKSLEDIVRELQVVKADYNNLLMYMNKARKMALEDDPQPPKKVFQMEKNGNLESIVSN